MENKNDMEAMKKLAAAREKIRSTPLKKEGTNTFSKYKYFTPEQIAELTSNPDFGLFNKFDLVRTELGLTARLSVIDIESGGSVDFQIATDIPEIKATNVAQQLGGCVTYSCVTYSERYLLQIAYDIKDNNLDFDTDQKKGTKKESMTPEHKRWNEAINHLKKGGSIENIKKQYEITEDNIHALMLASE
jgi:hypothetical protein